ncbi:hypothetical protein ACYOEI_30525 [Singulisphaera rosea]
MPLRGWSGVARYGLPGLLLGLTLMAGFGGIRGPVLMAQSEKSLASPGERPRAAAAATGDPSGTLAFTTQADGGAQILYLIDTRSQAFTVYRIDPMGGDKTVKLVGARQYLWDMKLSQFNNQQPEVAAIESMVKSLGRPIRR